MRKNKRKKTKRETHRSKLRRIAVLRQLFFWAFLSGLLGAVYWARPIEVAWEKEKAFGELKGDLTAVLPPFGNRPWEEVVRVEGRDIYPAYPVIRADEEPVGREADLEFRTEEKEPLLLAVAYEIQVQSRTGFVKFLIGVDGKGTLTGVKLRRSEGRRSLRGFYRKERRFFSSLKGRGRNTLFLVEDGGVISPMKISSEISREWLRGIRQGIRFFWENKDALIKGSGSVSR